MFYDGGESIKLPFFKGGIGLKLVTYFSKKHWGNWKTWYEKNTCSQHFLTSDVFFLFLSCVNASSFGFNWVPWHSAPWNTNVNTAHPGDEKRGRSSASQEMTKQGKGIAFLDGKHKEVLLKLEISQIKQNKTWQQNFGMIERCNNLKTYDNLKTYSTLQFGPDMI